jgi:DnaJ-class molecular chaperone
MTSDQYKKYHETLGLNSGASKKEINKAFRELSHLYHPDNVVGKPQNIQEIEDNLSISYN